jgi:nitrogen fixation NifU-like protein
MNEEDFERIVRNIQNRIFVREGKIYSRTTITEYRNPSNVGRLEYPDGYGKITGPCDDTMEFYINVENGRISEILFMTDGCGSSVACGSMATRMVEGRSVEEAGNLTTEDILDALGGLPEDDQHCARMAADGLQMAVRNYLDGEKDEADDGLR